MPAIIDRCSGQPVPDEVLATANFTSQRALYVSDRKPRGLICLALPTKVPSYDDNLLEILQVCPINR